MSRINKEMYDKNHYSGIFGTSIPKEPKESNQELSRNIPALKMELKTEANQNQKKKNNFYKSFVNKEKEKPESKKLNIIRNQYHNDSDIFFTRDLSSSMKKQLTEEAFPKKKEFKSDYNPEKYVKFNNSSFDKKMYDLYNEKGNKYMENKKEEKGKPKKIKMSSKGYSEYLEKFNNDNYSNIANMKKNHFKNHKETQQFIYNKEVKYNPTSTASENYNREFESDIFNIPNKNYKKFINKPKKNNLFNRSMDYCKLKQRNINVKGKCKWPADFDWTKNSELIFKSNIKNIERNKSMSAFERNQIDSVKNVLEGKNENKDNPKKIKRNRSDLGLYDFKRPKFDKKKYNFSRALKLSNNCSVLDNEKNYENNLKMKDFGKKYGVKEYLVAKPGKMDIYEFGKLLKKKGIHLVEVGEKEDIIKNEKNKEGKDRIINFKIRENILDNNKNEKLKELEIELKKKNRQLQIRPAPKKKNHRLRSYDYAQNHNAAQKRVKK